MMAGQGLK